MTEIGPVDTDVPRDVNSSFDPQIVKKRQRRLTGIDEIVLSLTAKGLTTGEIAAQFASSDDIHTMAHLYESMLREIPGTPERSNEEVLASVRESGTRAWRRL